MSQEKTAICKPRRQEVVKKKKYDKYVEIKKKCKTFFFFMRHFINQSGHTHVDNYKKDEKKYIHK